MSVVDRKLVGVGLYTPGEASRLIDVDVGKLVRWLRGHQANARWYAPLWHPEINLGDGKIYLSFRDLLEARVAARFIAAGLSAQKVRRAVDLAREIVGDRPMSTAWLRTDGRAVFLRVLKEDGDEPRLLDLFSRQYAFDAVVGPSFRDVDFEGPLPTVWWPTGRRSGIVIDPQRSFGQPIERETSIPAEILANAAQAEGSIDKAAKAWSVPASAVRRATRFQQLMGSKQAA